MSGLEFASATIGQLIWPIVAVVIAFILRKPLRSLAGSSRIKEVEAGPNGVKLAFDYILDSAEEVAVERVDPTPDDPATGKPRDDSGVAFRKEMALLADVSPRAAVMESHARIETLLRSALLPVMQHVEPYGRRPVVMRDLTNFAVSVGIIDADEERILRDLSSLRNLVAHESDTVISRDDAMRYIDLAAEVVFRISRSLG